MIIYKNIRLFILAFISLVSLTVSSQTTIIKGQITDANNGSAIPFANIVILNTTVGTTSDFDGNFKVEYKDNKSDTISVMVLGFKTRNKKFILHKTQTINFQLEAESYTLEEVVVVAGENPAHQILRNVWENKRKYNMDKLDSYQYKSYTRVEISLDNIEGKMMDSPFLKPFKAVVDSLQKKAGPDGKVLIPFMVTETISDVYYLKNPKRKKEHIHSTKTKGLVLDDGTYAEQFLGQTFQNYNFYDNWLPLFDRNFVSPIARFGLMHYKYYLEDSVTIDGRFCYEIRFSPKNVQDLAFTGRMWISKKEWALVRLKVETNTRTNINFIDKYQIEMSFAEVLDSAWMPKNVRVLVDMSQFGPARAGVSGVFTIYNSDFVINQPKESTFYSDPIIVDKDSEDKDTTYWNKQRNDLSGDIRNIEQSYAAIDSLRNAPQIKRWRIFSKFLLYGYFEPYTKYWEFGHFTSFVGYNSIEGFRLGMGGRTTIDFSDMWVLSGYGAYGFEDQQFKYKFGVERFLNRDKWTKIGFKHSNDFEKLGIDPDFLEDNEFQNIFFNIAAQFGQSDRMIWNRKTKFWVESDLFVNFNQKIQFIYSDAIPLGEYNFAYFKDDGKLSDKVINSTIRSTSRFAPAEKKLIKENTRTGLGAMRQPVYILDYTLGLKGVMGSDFNYHKVAVSMEQKIRLGVWGKLRYRMQLTRVFGTVPYPMLNIFQGNESYIATERSYNMMNYFEFAADQSFEVLFTHHFEGMFFNRIPLFKRLEWRAVASGGAIVGAVDQKTYDLMPLEYNGSPLTTYKRLDPTKPYVELSYGVENIFKLLRIQFYHRLTYTEGVNNFGIKASLFITL
jgi:hypothetical protein